MRPRRESLGELFVPVDFQVRVFGTSGIVDRMPEHMSIHNIHIYGCMNRRSCYIWHNHTNTYYKFPLTLVSIYSLWIGLVKPNMIVLS